ncbi:hypothetical protein [Microseira wollei]|uniref:hypothetical protein n=1 Tax=Microseira wollei TaxID=467598 RepID=UPI001CFEE013|nr:hypothetical protein [Microseira wollei]
MKSQLLCQAFMTAGAITASGYRRPDKAARLTLQVRTVNIGKLRLMTDVFAS